MSKQESNVVRFIWEDLFGGTVEDVSLGKFLGMETQTS